MYKMLVEDKMPHFLRMELNLKESQKYVKQGRTYTSLIPNLETLMWFVYEMEQNRTHRQLGIFAACEREILHTVQDISHQLEQISKLSEEFGNIDISAEKREVFEMVLQAAESTRRKSYNGFWNMRGEINDRSEELMQDAAKNDPGKLKNACSDLNLGELLHNLHNNFHDNAAEMKKTLEEIKRIEPDPPWGYAIQEINGRVYFRMLDRENYDREALLFSSLRKCAEKILDGCTNAVKVAEKAIMKYEHIESRAAGTKKNNIGEKEERRPSVRGKMEILQMQQPEKSGRVAEEKGKEVIQ
ncbi:MAG: hypothetical protein K2P64_01005 [Lachnospiraceae bacterium]|nr:hypothetical protein [Lachnospiraceae bacterium]